MSTSTTKSGGDGRGEERLGEDERVAEAERGAPEGGDEGVGDAAAEPRLDEPAGEEEGERDEPGDGAAEGREGSGEGERTGEHSGAEAEQRDGAERQRWQRRRLGRRCGYGREEAASGRYG